MVFQTEDRIKSRKQQAEAAIQLALQGRWQDAVHLNRAILDAFPTDVDAYNRLGKALTELGKYADARAAYMKALEIDPLNSISRKNLDRLATLGEKAPPRPGNQKLSPQMFIEETGKTGITTLIRPNHEVANRMTAGDQVALQRLNGTLAVHSLDGDYIGEVEPKLAQRLVKLMDGGNEYVAAISALSRDDVRVFIRETFQHADQTGKLSFLPTAAPAFRPYTRGRLVRHDTDDDYYADDEDGDSWGRLDDSEETTATIRALTRSAAADEEDADDEDDTAVEPDDSEDDE